MQKFFTSTYYSEKSVGITTDKKALLALGWVSFFWGTTWLAAKEGVSKMPALQMAGMRQCIAGALFLVFFMAKKHPLPKRKQWLSILILSVLNFMLSNGLSTWGIKYISSGLASIISAIFPLWLVIITTLRGRSLPPKAMLGLLLGFGGVCIIFYEHLKDLLNPDFRFGLLLSLVATVSWAFGTLYTKQQAVNFNPYYSLAFQMLISGITLLLITHATGNEIKITAIPASSWWAMGYLVLIGSVFTFVAYVYSLQHLSAALASVYAYINPIVAVLLGALLLNERLSLLIAIGGIITISGVYLVNISFKKKIILNVSESEI